MALPRDEAGIVDRIELDRGARDRLEDVLGDHEVLVEEQRWQIEVRQPLRLPGRVADEAESMVGIAFDVPEELLSHRLRRLRSLDGPGRKDDEASLRVSVAPREGAGDPEIGAACGTGQEDRRRRCQQAGGAEIAGLPLRHACARVMTRRRSASQQALQVFSERTWQELL